MRFLVDENLPRHIGYFLQSQGYDALIVRDSNYVGASDRELWTIAVEEKRILVTQDRDFPLQGMEGLPVAVILIRPRDNRPAAIQSQFERFWASVAKDDLEGYVFSVEVSRYRRRPMINLLPETR